MGQRTEKKIAEAEVKLCFPGLEDDEQFAVTSPETSKYNCIAWAYLIENRWMWPPAGMLAPSLDAVTFWPNDNASDDVSEFIKAFEGKGYRKCDNSEYEEGFQKIALYVESGTTCCTHAARQKRDGTWTSKLGEWYDIQHGTPYTIEGEEYGEVYCIMKRKFP